MKILHIITKSELGGAQSVLASIVNKLCMEHEVSVIAGEGDGKLFDILDNRINKIRYPYIKRALSPINDAKAVLFLRKQYKKLQPDVIHLHSSKAGLLGRLALPKEKIVYTVHGFDSIRLKFRLFLPIERFMQKRCSTIVGVSLYDWNNLQEEGITNNLEVIYNGVDTPVPCEKPILDIPQKYCKVILCIARMAKPKRYDIFLECAKRLPNYAFIWIGNTESLSNIPENVFLLGNISHAKEYCQCADMFFLPSDYEGLPIVILEAMSYGLPIIASAVGGIPELVINGENGYTCANDATLFTDKIEELMKNEQTYNKFSECSFKLYNKYFTVDKMINKYLTIYYKICEEKH